MVLQKNKNYICINIFKEIYFKELAHEIMVAWWIKNLIVRRLADWDIRKGCNLSPKSVCWWTKKSQCCRWSPKAVCWRILSFLGRFSLLLYSGLQLINVVKVLPHYEGPTALPKSTKWNVSLIQKYLTEIFRLLFH